jgi:lipoprotein-anchoring transpeptidase ErfK/SrfK
MIKRAIKILICVLAPIAGVAAASASSTAQVAPQQQTAELFTAHNVYNAPDGSLLTSVADHRPLTRERTVLPVLASTIDDSVDASGQLWLEVRLPGRTLTGGTPPQTGWISAAHTQISSTPWHIVVDLGARRVLVYRDGQEVQSYPAVVGKPSTPTPMGEYFVEENVKMAASAAGAPFALATSDRSRVLQDFEGGPGQIAIHGIENLGGTLGTAESHGCIRLATAAITWLAARITPGVPITVD